MVDSDFLWVEVFNKLKWSKLIVCTLPSQAHSWFASALVRATQQVPRSKDLLLITFHVHITICYRSAIPYLTLWRPRVYAHACTYIMEAALLLNGKIHSVNNFVSLHIRFYRQLSFCKKKKKISSSKILLFLEICPRPSCGSCILCMASLLYYRKSWITVALTQHIDHFSVCKTQFNVVWCSSEPFLTGRYEHSWSRWGTV